MRGTISYDKKGNKILKLDGQVVTQEEFDAAIPSKPFEVPMATMAYDSSRPLINKSAGCHPTQVKQFNEDLSKAGIVGARYRTDGSVEYASRAARKAHARFRGLVDFDGGYGDA
jgi:RecJ-like exonuclease